MVKRNEHPSRLVRIVGSDSDYLYFTTPSWTRRELWHDQTIDKRTGEVSCTCEGCTYHKMQIDFLLSLHGGEVHTCRHIKGLLVAHRRLLRENYDVE